jgi:hypothetical protein
MILLQPMVREPYTTTTGEDALKRKYQALPLASAMLVPIQAFFLILSLPGYLFMGRFFLLLCLVVPVALPIVGCGGSGSTKVLDGEVAKDPSLSDDYSGSTGGDPTAAEVK